MNGEFECRNAEAEDGGICVEVGLRFFANGLVDCCREGEDEMAEFVDPLVGIMD